MSTLRHRRGGFAPLEFLRRSAVVDPPEAHDEELDAEGFDPDQPAERAFADHRRRSPLRAGIAVAVVAALGTVTAGAVMLTSASNSSATNLHSLTVDPNRSDVTRAVPQSDNQLNGAGSAGIGSRTNNAGRGSSVSRSNVRSEIDKAMSQSAANQRSTDLDSTTDGIQNQAVTASETVRAKELDASIVAVKKQAKKIAAEKKAAEQKLVKAAAASGVKITAGTTSAITNDGGASLPINPGSYTLGSYWGETGVWARWHTGEDFVAACGTPLHAVAAGVVGESTGGSWAGNHVVIHLANGGSVLYAHMTSKSVSVGQTVKPGQLIGYSGETGRAFGCHLHFEYYPAGTTPGDVYSTTDPLVFLRSIGLKP
ncbi:M23 family metallopeptidase [Acidipropionibacterium jensenii]|uniref:M23 family metallopeptidase n=1 Tax=Acidipropionibacterium jensenii TaxID=1749 RepID=UPI000BC3080C|nr:M23 family metallopeptidase [Acidipropionibacterium jensenii]MDN5976784.1 M23 family metallopeptidase [Acidipropionibacterium jensenii]MDN5995636.1 M23 family metallopeptidase [Acidipropionibacterium jensenii]MDN6020610.1 M23 family metallopeptidase [Acidipropionibacterium jensenii]MDN6425823.1 M23 family metallopeptidase [Acidipropionibacterium jensenii]MDN6441236.1 M23 family metallopeptidase [Acidipropionibacterium jensenii]